MPIAVKETAQGASFLVRVAPRASRTAVLGVLDEGRDTALKIALQAPPVEGRANAALIEFLSELLGTPRSAIAIAGGDHARNKRILVRDRSAAEIAAALGKALTPLK
jgi:uncharacterized protein